MIIDHVNVIYDMVKGYIPPVLVWITYSPVERFSYFRLVFVPS